jgi:hypothetical protein
MSVKPSYMSSEGIGDILEDKSPRVSANGVNFE